MSHYLIRRIAETANIDVRLDTEVIAVHGDDHLDELTLCNHAGEVRETLPASYLFVFIGAAPRTEWLDGVLARTARVRAHWTGPAGGGRRPRGWRLDRDPYFLESSVPGVFAAGDVRANSVKRVASAVGEGAMAISSFTAIWSANE